MSMPRILKPYALKWVTSLLLIGAIIYRVDFNEVWRTAETARPWLYPVIIVISLLTQVFATLKWRVFISERSFSQLLQLNMISVFYTFLLPSSVTGDIAKAVKVQVRRHDTTSTHASIVADRLLGIATVVVLMLPCAALSSSDAVSSLMLMSCVALCAGGLIIIALARRLAQSDQEKSGNAVVRALSAFHVVRRLLTVIPTSLQFLKQRSAMVGMLYGTLFHLLMTAHLYVCFASLSYDVGFVDCMILNLVSQIASFIPVGIGGIGVRDVSIIGVAGLLGYSATAIWAGVLLGYPVILLAVIIGYICDLGWSSKTQ